jgi:hypothetical protein
MYALIICSSTAPMVRRYCSSYDYHVSCLAHLPDQVPRTLCYPSSQDLVPVFRDPDHVVLQFVCRVGAVPIFRHSSILQDLS